MKYKLTIYLFASIFITALISSCSCSNNVVSNSLFQKRKYKKGWHLKKSGLSSNKKITDVQSIKIKNENEVALLTSDNKELSLVIESIKDTPLLDSNDCSEIILINGNTIKAIILEIRILEIDFKQCSNKEGRTYSILKSEVFMIKDKNGDTVEIKEENRDSDEYKEESRRLAEKNKRERRQTLKGWQILLLSLLSVAAVLLGLIFVLYLFG